MGASSTDELDFPNSKYKLEGMREEEKKECAQSYCHIRATLTLTICSDKNNGWKSLDIPPSSDNALSTGSQFKWIDNDWKPQWGSRREIVNLEESKFFQ